MQALGGSTGESADSSRLNQGNPLFELHCHADSAIVGRYKEASLAADSLLRWKTGDPVVIRGVGDRKIWWACAATVVKDSPDLIALYWQAGAPNRIPERRLTPQDLFSDGHSLVSRQWTDTDVLMLVTPGSSHAVYVMWETGQAKLRCWYIDLQEPLRRTGLGFDTMDQFLDIVISADKSTWHWKDEDEFAEAIAVGFYSADQAQSIRAEGERVIHLLETRQSPFYDGWETWSPPIAWDIPSMPEGWDQIES